MDSKEWYSKERPNYKQLASKVESIIIEILAEANIEFHFVSSRAKTTKSFQSKIDNAKYTDPQNQITDLAGIRIITYVEDSISPICKIIEDTFKIDPQNSIDKSESLGLDKVGYKSVHFVAELPDSRLKLAEYKKFEGMKFEIQVRTILQHSWAEIEHDRNYKFSGELPKAIQRRFKLLAGLLELADNEFNSISKEIDSYSQIVKRKTEKGELEVELNSTSLIEYSKTKFSDLIDQGLKPVLKSSVIITELKNFGINTLSDLNNLIPKDIIEKAGKTNLNEKSLLGLYRALMMINDYKRYFKDCYNSFWGTFSNSTAQLFKAYGIKMADVKKELTKANEKRKP